MFRDEKLEMKVGLFIGIGIFLMFLIVFSIGDFYGFEKGYNIKVIFDYVNGLTEDAPVRLAGVHVGEVKKIEIFRTSDSEKTRVRVFVWVKGNAKIELDAVARINTLGLLGEQYLEISPGEVPVFLKSGDTIVGKNPVHVGMQMESMVELVQYAKEIFARLAEGEGTIGKLLVEEKIYDDLEAFVADIRAHPWKLLTRTKDSRRSGTDSSGGRGTTVSPR